MSVDTNIIIWIIGIVVVLAIAIIGFILYRKKKQYDFMFKMMKSAKEQEKKRQQEEAFVEKQAVKSKTEADNIILALGGSENMEKIEQCAIRLRVYVKDNKKVNQKELKAAGVSGVLKTTKNLQLIVGDRAEQIYAEIQATLGKKV